MKLLLFIFLSCYFLAKAYEPNNKIPENMFFSGLSIFLILFFSFIVYHYFNLDKRIKAFLSKFPKKGFALFLSLFLIYMFVIVAFPNVPLQGDEPHYMLMVQSLITNGNFSMLNLKPLEIGYLTPLNYSNYDALHIMITKNGEYYPHHEILLPILLYVPYILGKVFAVRIFMCVICALYAYVCYKLLSEFYKDWFSNMKIIMLIFLTIPLMLYSKAVFTETTAGLIVSYAMLIIVKIMKNKPVSCKKLIFSSMLVSILPFLGLKYIFFSLPIAIAFILLSKLKNFKILSCSIMPFLMIIAYFFYVWNLTGSFDISSRYSGKSLTMVFGALTDFLVPLFKAFSQIFDSTSGIFFYSPYFIFSFFGFFAFIKDKKKLILLFLALPYYFIYMMTSDFGGWAPPGRIVTPLIGVFALLLKEGILKKKSKTGLYVFIAFSITVCIIYLSVPSILFSRQFFDIIGQPYFNARLIVPALENIVFGEYLKLFLLILYFILIA